MWLITALRVVCVLLLLSAWGFLELTWPTSRDAEILPLRVSIMSTLTLMLLWKQWLNVLSAWLKRRRIVLEEAPRPSPDSWIEPITGPRFDPSYGVFAPVNVDGRIYNVILQPDYWPILNPAISRDVKECAIPASPIGSVGVGKEPQSLVFLQDTLGRSIGVGCRVQCGKSSVLLTAWHVLDAAKLSDIYLAKCNRRTGTPFRVKFERDWPVEYECAHEDIDISAVQVPDSVWSKLGVTAAKVGMPRANAPVTCFGGLCHEPASSVGRYAPEGLSGEHSCSTRSGWSGTPLYSAGKVVGVHIEWHKIGASNRATAVWPFHLQKESWSGDSDSGSEISDEEMDARSDVRSYVVKGRGRFRTAGREFSRTADYAPFDYEAADKAVVQRVKDFASREKWLNEEDEDDYGPVLKPSWFRKEASLPSGHLNFQGASSGCSAPSVKLEDTNGAQAVASKKKECLSLPADVRVSNLESLVELLLAQQSEMQSSISQLSLSLTGQKEEPKPKLVASSSKRVDSGQPKPRVTFPKQPQNLSKSTPKSDNVPSSSTESGTKRRYRKRSQKSRKGKSTGTPAPASH